MKQRVVIIHGWQDNPNKGWLGWCTDQLRQLGYIVDSPQMPREKIPNIDIWIQQAKATIGQIDEYTVLIGHSLGTYILLNLLTCITTEQSAKALVLVAGFATVPRPEAQPLFTEQVNLSLVTKHVQHVYHIYSDSDPMLDITLSQTLAQQLPGKTLRLDGFKHFTAHDLTEFRELIKIVQKELPL